MGMKARETVYALATMDEELESETPDDEVRIVLR